MWRFATIICGFPKIFQQNFAAALHRIAPFVINFAHTRKVIFPSFSFYTINSMCGIAGYFSAEKATHPDAADKLRERIGGSLFHRGPDSGGAWHDEMHGVTLLHRRLAILDLSPQGHQPMRSASGRFVMVYNGEIYNFPALKKELEALGHPANGSSDTAVLLCAIEAWGIEETLRRCSGMFAFAVWDAKDCVLHLARDRVGEKPLYYGWLRGSLFFASELKAFRVYAADELQINPAALHVYLQYGRFPPQHSVYKNIYKLPPASYLTLSLDACRNKPEAFTPSCDSDTGIRPRRYWNAYAVSRGIQEQRLAFSAEDATNELERLLSNSISQQMIADVPVGAFLSGGIDSSLIVALMQQQHRSAVKTFTIGFAEEEYDEAPYARAIAAHLGTDHTEMYVTAAEAMSVIPQLPCMYDEPLADQSQIPTFLVSKLARTHVTVSLSGDGGDELFGGYERHIWANRILRGINILPGCLRSGLHRALLVISPERLTDLLAATPITSPLARRVRHAGPKLHKFATLLSASSEEDLYLRASSYWPDPRAVVAKPGNSYGLFSKAYADHCGSSAAERFMFSDFVSYLPDNILVKLDRAAMAASLESRVPFLDQQMIEFAWGLPEDLKIRNGKGKWILRALLAKHVPRQLTDRPKMGFTMPIGRWLRTSLRDWAEELLSEQALKNAGFLNTAAVRTCWLQHQSGRRDFHKQLWNVLMFQAWQRAYVDMS